MKYKARKEGSITIVTITGEFIGGPVCHEFLQYGDTLIEEGAQVIYDLTEVPHVSEVGVGLITHALVSLKKRDGDLRLVVAAKRVEAQFQVTRLERLMKIYKTLEEAIASFAETSESSRRRPDTTRTGS